MAAFEHFVVEQLGSVTVVRLKDPFLLSTLIVSALHDELLEFVDRSQPLRLVIDFAAVSGASTVVINALLRAKKRVLALGGQLRLCGLCPNVRSAYRTLNLDGTVFQIDATVDEAQHALRGAGPANA